MLFRSHHHVLADALAELVVVLVVCIFPKQLVCRVLYIVLEPSIPGAASDLGARGPVVPCVCVRRGCEASSISPSIYAHSLYR